MTFVTLSARIFPKITVEIVLTINQTNIVLNSHQWFDAAKYNKLKIIEQFLSGNFNIEARDDTGRTALHIAAANNSTDVAEVLLKHKANLEALMKDEGTPLRDAVASGHVSMTLLLLRHGANYQVRDECEWTILHWMANEDCLPLVDALSSNYPNLIPNLLPIKRWNGISPLHMVTSAAMAKKFIALGAEIDGPTTDQVDTPLFEATFQNQFEVVVCLIQHGANILQVNHYNETALDIATKKGYHQLKNFFEEVLFKQNQSGRKKTGYVENITAALSLRAPGVDIHLIEFHANLRINLFFLTLIAYYNSGLEINIEHTNSQHGKSSGDTRGCHSAILTSLWDTKNEYPPHRYNTRAILNTPSSYRTSILNGTHFEDSLNLTVELDKSVNYFDTYHIEGLKNTLMRAIALEILNQVSRKILDPIQGMNQFLTSMHRHFLSIEKKYYNNKELPTSPQKTRYAIYTAQYKGTFFNACGFKSANEVSRVIELKDDYIQSQLPLSKDERIQLRGNPNLFSIKDRNKIYEKAFLQVKEDMDLPMQYRSI